MTTLRARLGLAPVLLLAALLLAACGDEESDGPGESGDGFEPVAGDEEITPEAVAAVALEHVDAEPSSSEAEGDEQGVGASFRFNATGEYDGDLLGVGVAELEEAFDCETDDDFDECEATDVEGGRLVVAWDEVEPEEDPGIVSVWMERDDEMVGVYYAGEEIEGDPRDQDLPIDVDTMIDIVQDGRLSLTTSQEVVDLGEDVEWAPQG